MESKWSWPRAVRRDLSVQDCLGQYLRTSVPWHIATDGALELGGGRLAWSWEATERRGVNVMSVLRRYWRMRGVGERGQATVEFAIVSIFLLLTVLGAIDFGRAIFLQSELENAVREAAREARTRTANGGVCGEISKELLEYRVRNIKNPDDGGACNQGEYPRPGLERATVTYSCAPSCTSGGKLTVTARLPFKAVVQEFLGIGPLTLTATATVTLE